MSNKPQKMAKNNLAALLILFFISTNILGCKKENNSTVDHREIVQSSENYKEVTLDRVKIKEDLNTIVYKFQASNTDNVFLVLDLEKEIAILEIDSQKIQTDFNFTYDISVDDAIKEIKLLKNNKGNLIYLLPVATEEYLTFQILKYDIENKSYTDDVFHFETHENILNQYINSNAKLFEKNSNYTLAIGSYSFKGLFKTKVVSTPQTSNKNIDFKGLYNICLPIKIDDSIKAETCYEIKIESNFAMVESNTKNCVGKYKVSQTQDDQVNLINETDDKCMIKIKKSSQDYLINLDGSNTWKTITKE